MKGWRKFALAATAMVMAFALALLGKLTTEFATVAAVAVGAFSAGNAVEHYTSKGAGDAA